MPSRPSRILSLLISGAVAFTVSAPLVPAFAETAPASAPAKQSSGKVFSQQELDELLAPIALHPDALLAQILMASTYPLDIVEAARWRKANPKIEGQALEDAMVKQSWDPSVKSLTTFPTVLDMMSEKIDWTQKLGDAFLGQQTEVMQTVQKLRAKAKQAGSLADTKEQKVTTSNEGGSSVIIIEQADPKVVYVPTYNPAVVYGTWWYPAPPPYYYYPPGYVPGAAFFTFTAGVIVGGALWGNCNWGHNDININVNRYNQVNHFDSNNVNNIKNGNWQHNPEQRRGVPYQSQGAQSKFGGAQVQNNKARDEFRGRAESGRQDLGQQGFDRNAAGNRPSAGTSDRASAGNRAGGGAADNRASSMDRGGGYDRGSAQPRASSSDRSSSSAFGGVSSGARANDYSSRGSSSRAGMSSGGGARAGGGGGRRR
ncbi:DUF3300 domain-containing protein [Niveibacterium umoris]|uniref:Putative membrane protein YgcG n=1 Tax=Niveibacterium umoris TaxID=1193620 RepID=A0A840BQJ6_9RHOO|nr:DUF3300 domain-containing protein [Niveibacterium umoris]MBB4013942.1 putative membrane protein YgcG [Niveibacterium umoris]